MSYDAIAITSQIFKASTPVLSISGLGGRSWFRNVPKNDGRYGPWLQSTYEVLDKSVWLRKQPCLYLVADGFHQVAYVGISRKNLKERWRTSPAYDLMTGQKLQDNQLFHSQCWRQIQDEVRAGKPCNFEVRCISGAEIKPVLEKIGNPLASFLGLEDDHEGIVAAVERWLCNHQSDGLVRWNKAMTKS